MDPTILFYQIHHGFDHTQKFINELYPDKLDQIILVNNLIYHAHDSKIKCICRTELFDIILKNPDSIKESIIIIDQFHIKDQELELSLILLSKQFVCASLIILAQTLDPYHELIHLFPSASCNVWDYIETEKTIIYTDDKQDYGYKTYIDLAEIVYGYHKKNYGGSYAVYVPGRIEANLVKDLLRKKDHNITTHILDNGNHIKSVDSVSIIVGHHDYFLGTVSLIVDSMVLYNLEFGLDDALLSYPQLISHEIIRTRQDHLCEHGIYVPMMLAKKYDNLPKTVSVKDSSCEKQILQLSAANKISLVENLINKDHLECILRMAIKSDYYKNIVSQNSFIHKLPFRFRQSLLLYHSLKYNNDHRILYTSIICLVHCYRFGNPDYISFFNWPRKDYKETGQEYNFRIKDIQYGLEKKFGGYSDIDTLFNIWIAIFKIRDINKIKAFCTRNYLNIGMALRVYCMVNFYHDILGIQIRHNLVVDKKLCNREFFDLLNLVYEGKGVTFQYTEAELTANYIGSNTNVKINDRSIRLANLGNDKKQIGYPLINKLGKEIDFIHIQDE